jgi:glutaminyl-tRNA synthetase
VKARGHESVDFIRAIVQADLASNRHDGRVVTRFPPEPNGYPHIGHAKSICLNFGVARDFGGHCNLRFDDTNPTTEDIEYVKAIERDVRWLGFDWGPHVYHASDYFERLYQFAIELIEQGLAYVDGSSDEQVSAHRGTITEPGRPTPDRGRSVADNLDLFRRMRAGEFAEGQYVLRAKIDLASPNMKMRDPVVYRIRHRSHYRTGDAWCIYPIYDFAHCLSDAIEGITHSICTLEFENNRELYDWYLDHLKTEYRPHQYEFARLNLTHFVMSKRLLLTLVNTGQVKGWDDPRMPTLSGLRRRGYTPAAIREFCDRIGVAKTNSTVELELLEFCLREDLNRTAPRALCVMKPLKLVIDNYPEGKTESFDAPFFPPDVGGEGSRKLQFSRELYIEQEDFAEDPPKKWHRLAPGAEVRLRYAYFVTCKRVVKNSAGEVIEIGCEYDPSSIGGAASDGRKVRGTLHWVSAKDAVRCEVRLYDRLFVDAEPDLAAAGADYSSLLNPDSLKVVDALIEPSVSPGVAGSQYQFERHGFFVVDPDTTPDHLVFNRTVTLRDSWAKIVAEEKGQESKRAQPKAAVQHAAAPKAPASAARGASDVALGPQASALQTEFQLTHEQARLLGQSPELVRFYRDAVSRHADAKLVANWVTTEVLRELKERTVSNLPFDGAAIGELVELLAGDRITTTAAKEVFALMLKGEGAPARIVEARGLGKLSDQAALARTVESVLSQHPDHVQKYKAGQSGLLGFLVGQVMRATGGRADAKQVNTLVRDTLAR